MLNKIQKTKKRNRRMFRRSRGGATAIEFALVCPTFLVVIVFCAEFSRMSLLRNLAQNATYEAARLVISEGATVQDGIDRAKEIIGRVGFVQADITINGSNGVANQGGTVPGELDFDTAEVTARVEIILKDNAVILPSAMFGESKITAQMTLRTERYRGFFDASEATN
ncbi:MAG: hypothetical protein ACI87E_003297 [Mariniblastus sp.]|jgi:hypothetical protein